MKSYMTIVSIILVLMTICGCQPEAEVKTDQAPLVAEPETKPATSPEQPAQVQVEKIVTEQQAEAPVDKPAVKQVIAEAVIEAQVQADRLLVTINGLEIHESEVLEMVKPQLNRVAQRANPEQLKQYKQQLIQGTIEKIIVEKLLDEKVKAGNVTVTDEEVDAKILELASSQQPPLSMEDFKALVEAYGQDFEETRKGIRKGLCYQKVVESQWNDNENEVAESEVQDYYNENKQQFETPEQVRASHILIKVDTSDPNADPNQLKAAAKAETEKLLEQIKSGADFAELAKQHSACPSSARGGDLGPFTRGRMAPPFEKAAFELEVGQVSDIVETQFGYHIIKVAEHQKTGTLKYDEVKDDLLDTLKQQKQQQLAQEYIMALKAEADIVYPPGKKPMRPRRPMSPQR